MDPRNRQRALEAAAKVALSVTTLAGCGGKVLALEDGGSPWTVIDDTPTSTPPNVPPPTRPVTDAASRLSVAPVDAGPVGMLDARVTAREAGVCDDPDLLLSEATTRCCLNHLWSAADAAAEPWLTVATPEVVSCCHSIVSYCETPAGKQSCGYDRVVALVCCPLVPSSRISSCAPWGPPTPPAMPKLMNRWVA
jgi:hypothetical protein